MERQGTVLVRPEPSPIVTKVLSDVESTSGFIEIRTVSETLYTLRTSSSSPREATGQSG